MLRRRLKFAAVLVAVVMALTGFSSSRGGRGGSGGDGGGCSSSEKSNGSYGNSGHHGSGDDADDDDYGSSGGSYSDAPTPTPTATSGVRAEVITCVRPAKGKRRAVTYAAVRLEVAAGVPGAYEVEVTFMDAAGAIADSGATEVTLEAGETRTVRVAMDSPQKVARVRTCEATASLAG
ncbi:hypothetical protein ABZ707_09745 [Streptomyces sp. NPDC006923]|uniref:hypothetical protein n=1 Tax=Streptomyces sp. NPDC006923 TaxID=3155355 RepID=UPI003403E894